MAWFARRSPTTAGNSKPQLTRIGAVSSKPPAAAATNEEEWVDLTIADADTDEVYQKAPC